MEVRAMHAQDLLVDAGLRVGDGIALAEAQPRAVASSRNASASDGAPQMQVGGVRAGSTDWSRVAPTDAIDTSRERSEDVRGAPGGRRGVT